MLEENRGSQYITELDFDIQRAIEKLNTLSSLVDSKGIKIGNDFYSLFSKTLQQSFNQMNIGDMFKNNFNISDYMNSIFKNLNPTKLLNMDYLTKQIEQVGNITEAQARKIATNILNQQEMTAAYTQREVLKTSQETIRANTEIHRQKQKQALQTAFSEEKIQRNLEEKQKLSDLRTAENKKRNQDRILVNAKIKADNVSAYDKKKTTETESYRLRKTIDTDKKLEVENIKSINARVSQQQKALDQINIQELKHQQNLEKIRLQSELKTSYQPNSMVGMLKGAGLYFGAYSAISVVKRVATETISSIKDIETSVIEVSRVIQDETYNAEKFTSSIFALSKEYGRSFEDVIEVSKRFSQSGYDVNETITATRSAMLALNTAELDVQNSTQSMIGIMQQWGMEASEMQLMIDKINLTADRNAITSQDLVDGLLRSSGAAKNAKISFDELVGILTVTREASGRTGKEVGNAINSLISYTQRTKSLNVFESLGAKVYADETRTQLVSVMDLWGQLAEIVKRGGDEVITTLETQTDLQNLYTEEVAKSANMEEEYNQLLEYENSLNKEGLNDLEKKSLYEQAGTHRRNYMIGLLENFSKIQTVVNGLSEAENYSINENAKAMETLQKKYQQFLTSLKELAYESGQNGFIDLMKSTLEASTAVIDFINGIGGINNVLKLLISLFIIVKRESIAKSFINISDTVKIAGMYAMDFSKSLTTATGRTQALSSASKGLSSINLAGWIGIVTTALTLASMAMSAYNQEQEEARRKSLELAGATSETSDSLSDLYSQYKLRQTVIAGTNTEDQKLLDLQDKIISKITDREGKLSQLTKTTKEYQDALEELTKEELAKQKIDIALGIEAASVELKKTSKFSNISPFLGSVDIAENYDPYSYIPKRNLEPFQVYKYQGIASFEPKGSDAKDILEFQNALKISLEELTDEYYRLLSAGKEAEASALLDSSSYRRIDAAIKKNSATLAEYIKLRQQEAQIDYIFKNGIPETTEELNKMNDSVYNSLGSHVSFKDVIYELGNSAFPSLSDSVSTANADLKENTDIMTDVEQQVKTVNEALDSIQSTYQTLSSAVEEYNTNGFFQIDTLQKILEIQPQYLRLLIDENGQLMFNATSLKNLALAQLDELEQVTIRKQLDLLSTLQNESAATEYLTGATMQNAVAQSLVTEEVVKQVATLRSLGGVQEEALNSVLSTIAAIQSSFAKTRAEIMNNNFIPFTGASVSQQSNYKNASKAREDSINNEIKALQNLSKESDIAYNKQIKSLEEVQKSSDKYYNDLIENIKNSSQKEIDELNRIKSERKKLRDEEDYAKNRKKLADELALAGMQTSRESLEQELELTEQIADLDLSEQRRKEDESIDEQIRLIEEKRDKEIESLEETRDKIKEKNELEIESLKKSQEAEKENYDFKIDNLRNLLESQKENASQQQNIYANISNSGVNAADQIGEAFSSNFSNILENAVKMQDALNKVFDISVNKNPLFFNPYVVPKIPKVTIPKSHTGSKIVSDGLVNLQAGEIVVRKDISAGLERIISQNNISNNYGSMGGDNVTEININAPMVSQNNIVESSVDAGFMANGVANMIMSKIQNLP